MNKLLKVVVCGTGFGTFYAEAVKRSEFFELAGIVAKGSERSRKCAAHYGVPLYHSPKEVPADIDAACVAIRSSSLGGAGTDMSLEFLKRGVNVILEQPVHHKDLMECYKTAKENHCCFMTGDLYLNMPEIRRFLKVCRYMREQGQKLMYLRAGSSVQAFYPFVEILKQLVPGGVIEELVIGEQRGGFKEANGKIGGIPISIQFNNDMNPEDPDNHMQLLHSFCCFYESGRLELVDTRGPLVWYPRLNMPWAVIKEGGLPETYPEHMLEKSVQVLTKAEYLDKPYYRFVEEGFVDGVGRDLLKLKMLMSNKKEFLIKAQQEQSSSRMWNELTSAFGYAVLNEKLNPKPMEMDGFKEACILEEERENNA